MSKPAKGEAKAEPLAVERRKIDALKPYSFNARVHPQAQIDRIVNSLKEFGWTNPILIDPSGEIIAGHGRLSAASTIYNAGGTIREWPDLSEVPVIVINGLSVEQRRAYRIADNKLMELGTWDKNVLGLELRNLALTNFDLALTGLNDLDLRSLNADGSSAFLNGAATELEGDEPAEDKVPRGFVILSFTVRPEERRSVLAQLRIEQAKRNLPTAAATLIALTKELADAATQ